MIEIVFLPAILLLTCRTPDSNGAVLQTGSLPWEEIAAKAVDGASFCQNAYFTGSRIPASSQRTDVGLNPNANYSFTAGKTMVIKLPSNVEFGKPSQEVYVNLAKWSEGTWRDLSKVKAIIEPNEMALTSGVREDGFYRLRLAEQDQSNGLSTYEGYAIVCRNWERGLFAFCHMFKEELELARDPNLILSSIAVSHIDQVMERASDRSFLSGEILKLLASAIRSREALGRGQCCEFVPGSSTHIQLKRFAGAPTTNFYLFIPENYNSSKKWPVLLRPSTLGGNHNPSDADGLIRLSCDSQGGELRLEWRDLKYMLDFLDEKLGLDRERIYVYGICSSGISAMSVALHYPDQFAACSWTIGNSYRHLSGNALNLPLYFGMDDNRLVPYGIFAIKCFQYYGCKYFSMPEEEIKFTNVREKRPQRVLYAIDSLDNPGAYWVTIEGRKDENFTATIDASVKDQTIYVKTKNVEAYSLDLAKAPVDSNGSVEIIENGRNLGAVTQSVFVRKPELYAMAKYIKSRFIHGPVRDVFRSPYVVVWGNHTQDKKFSQASSKLAKSLANGVPIYFDANMPSSLLDTHNIILVGTPESNEWLSILNKELPVWFEGGKIVANGRRYGGRDTGFVLIYPNPLNKDRYIAVFSGISSIAMENVSKAYSEMNSAQSSDTIYSSDVGIFEVADDGAIKWHVMERFNTLWNWHKQWGKVLAVAKSKHARWQWRQLVARALRKQLQADSAICMDPFRFPDSVLAGEITFRDIFNTFRNDWIIKVKVNGKQLKELLLTPINASSGVRADLPIMDGITATKAAHNPASDVPVINKLEDERMYTVAMPYNFVNGKQLGVGLKEYDILGEDYLVRIMGDYLADNNNFDLDTQLNNMTLNVLW